MGTQLMVGGGRREGFEAILKSTVCPGLAFQNRLKVMFHT